MPTSCLPSVRELQPPRQIRGGHGPGNRLCRDWTQGNNKQNETKKVKNKRNKTEKFINKPNEIEKVKKWKQEKAMI